MLKSYKEFPLKKEESDQLVLWWLIPRGVYVKDLDLKLCNVEMYWDQILGLDEKNC